MLSRGFRRVALLLGVALLAVAVVLMAAPPALAFPDVPSGHPYEKAIHDLSEARIIGGYTNGNFGLDDAVKRAQFAKMIVGTLDITPDASLTTRFTDLGTPDTSGYPHRWVQTAYDNGITYGTNAAQTLFDPWKSIRRDQVVSMMVRGAESLYPGVLSDPRPGAPSLFTGVAEPHGQNLRIAEHNGLLNGLIGMGSAWDVTATATRGEVAQMLWNLLNLIGEDHPGEGDVWVYVDGSGDYATLQAAVANVAPGTTIYLGSGTFALPDTLSVDSDLSLVGSGSEGPDATIVSCDGTVANVSGGTFSAEDLDFASTATTHPSDVLDVQNADVVLRDCSLSGANKTGTNGGYGLSVGTASTAQVERCIFTGNDEDGIMVGGDSKVQVEDSTCSHNGTGIHFWDSASGAATGNTCRDNTYDGIRAEGGCHVDLQQNVSAGNGYNGIIVDEAAVVTATHNSCTSNYYCGICCYGTSQVTLDHNTCQSNGDSNLVLGGHSTGAVRYNTCSDSLRKEGIEVSASASGVLENNVCLHNFDAGIWFADTSSGSAQANECAFGRYGILIDAGATPAIGANNLHDNTDDLVRL